MTRLRFLHYTDDRVTVYEYSEGTYKVLGYILQTRTAGWKYSPKRDSSEWIDRINLKVRELNDKNSH